MELIIPGEQHFYVKSVNAAERQRWLVALGSSKACLADTRTKKEKGNIKYKQDKNIHKVNSKLPAVTLFDELILIIEQ